MPEWARASWLLGSARADLVAAVGLYAAVVLEVLVRGLGPVTAVSASVCMLRWQRGGARRSSQPRGC